MSRRACCRRAGWNDRPFKLALEDLRERAELIARLREASLEPKLVAVTVSPAEIRAAYQKRLDTYQMPERRRLAVLWLEPSRDTERQAAAIERHK